MSAGLTTEALSASWMAVLLVLNMNLLERHNLFTAITQLVVSYFPPVGTECKASSAEHAQRLPSNTLAVISIANVALAAEVWSKSHIMPLVN